MPTWDDLNWFDKLFRDALIYAFSLAGFFAVPATFGRWRWFFPGWFAALNLFLLFAPASFHPRDNPVTYLALVHLPWILFCLSLAAGRFREEMIRTPLRSFLPWTAFRFTGAAYMLAGVAGDLPPRFGAEMAAGEVLTALGAVALWAAYRPDDFWYRGLLLFWNAYGLTAALASGVRMALANPELPFLRLPGSIHLYFMGFPQAWLPFFWAPLSIAVHMAVFFKLYLEWSAATPAPIQEASK